MGASATKTSTELDHQEATTDTTLSEPQILVLRQILLQFATGLAMEVMEATASTLGDLVTMDEAILEGLELPPDATARLKILRACLLQQDSDEAKAAAELFASLLKAIGAKITPEQVLANAYKIIPQISSIKPKTTLGFYVLNQLRGKIAADRNKYSERHTEIQLLQQINWVQQDDDGSVQANLLTTEAIKSSFYGGTINDLLREELKHLFALLNIEEENYTLNDDGNLTIDATVVEALKAKGVYFHQHLADYVLWEVFGKRAHDGRIYSRQHTKIHLLRELSWSRHDDGSMVADISKAVIFSQPPYNGDFEILKPEFDVLKKALGTNWKIDAVTGTITIPAAEVEILERKGAYFLSAEEQKFHTAQTAIVKPAKLDAYATGHIPMHPFHAITIAFKRTNSAQAQEIFFRMYVYLRSLNLPSIYNYIYDEDCTRPAVYSQKDASEQYFLSWPLHPCLSRTEQNQLVDLLLGVPEDKKLILKKKIKGYYEKNKLWDEYGTPLIDREQPLTTNIDRIIEIISKDDCADPIKLELANIALTLLCACAEKHWYQKPQLPTQAEKIIKIIREGSIQQIQKDLLEAMYQYACAISSYDTYTKTKSPAILKRVDQAAEKAYDLYYKLLIEHKSFLHCDQTFHPFLISFTDDTTRSLQRSSPTTIWPSFCFKPTYSSTFGVEPTERIFHSIILLINLRKDVAKATGNAEKEAELEQLKKDLERQRTRLITKQKRTVDTATVLDTKAAGARPTAKAAGARPTAKAAGAKAKAAGAGPTAKAETPPPLQYSPALFATNPKITVPNWLREILSLPLETQTGIKVLRKEETIGINFKDPELAQTTLQKLQEYLKYLKIDTDDISILRNEITTTLSIKGQAYIKVMTKYKIYIGQLQLGMIDPSGEPPPSRPPRPF